MRVWHGPSAKDRDALGPKLFEPDAQRFLKDMGTEKVLFLGNVSSNAGHAWICSRRTKWGHAGMRDGSAPDVSISDGGTTQFLFI